MAHNHAQGMESGREPCPYRIIDDVGSAFLIGAVGGSIWHGVKGAKIPPVVNVYMVVLQQLNQEHLC